MKIRKQVRALHKNLCQEVNNIIQDHNCGGFVDHSGKCVLCCLLGIRKIFAAIHLAREHNLCPNWFEAERGLYELLGEKSFFNKIEIELKEVANFPKKECENCRRIVTFYIPFKKLSRSRSKSQKSSECGHCGAVVELKELPALPPSKEKIKIKEDTPPRLRPRRESRAPAVRELSLEEIGLTLLGSPETGLPASEVNLQNQRLPPPRRRREVLEDGFEAER